MTMSQRSKRKIENCENWEEARRMLVDGERVRDIAELISKNDEYKGVKINSIVRALHRWREKHIGPIEVLNMIKSDKIESAIERLDVGVDALRDIEWLLEKQKTRVDRGLQLEDRTQGIILPTVSDAIDDMINQLIKYTQLLQSLGLQPKQPERFLFGGVSMSLSGDIGSSTSEEIVRRMFDRLSGTEKKDVFGKLLDIERVVVVSDGVVDV